MATMVEIWEVRVITVATAFHCARTTPPTGLINLATDVIGMKRMIFQVVQGMAGLVEIWEVRVITVATAKANR
jgi:hypothetical protein